MSINQNLQSARSARPQIHDQKLLAMSRTNYSGGASRVDFLEEAKKASSEIFIDATATAEQLRLLLMASHCRFTPAVRVVFCHSFGRWFIRSRRSMQLNGIIMQSNYVEALVDDNEK
jgi:hypothetical protein